MRDSRRIPIGWIWSSCTLSACHDHEQLDPLSIQQRLPVKFSLRLFPSKNIRLVLDAPLAITLGERLPRCRYSDVSPPKVIPKNTPNKHDARPTH
ncbi:hypothetical protein K503DRAFT_225234 [Rhizopogon vinicolor AM-OR11-026]|uniref:Uncharacterized protein n=1 Tax=Rhizopogon vinicolor AM-OR11-026 TaxID=1314800 RepID=A0A1B7MYG0_9AGAM|nr:hypothetical protein K503DRAFT_225234 [Rhizopogon vinicolor AM-OR11-026]